MADTRIPVEIINVTAQDGTSRMVPQVPLHEFVRHPHTDMQEEMDALANRYVATVTVAKQILSKITTKRRETGRTDAKLYWELGKVLQQFIDNNEKFPLFLNGIRAHFTRDLGISAPSWRKILRLYHLVPSKDLIDTSREWKFYRDAPTRVIHSVVAEAAAHGQELFSKQEPLGTEQASHLAVQERKRIELYLSRETLERLRILAARLGLPAEPATIIGALLRAVLAAESRRDVTLGQLLRTVQSLAGESSRPRIRGPRNR
jgi:hypothetical protein